MRLAGSGRFDPVRPRPEQPMPVSKRDIAGDEDVEPEAGNGVGVGCESMPGAEVVQGEVPYGVQRPSGG